MQLIDIAINGFKPQPLELRPFNTSQKNAKNQLELVTGPTYQAIEIITNITDLSKIPNVLLELNGRPIVNVSAAELKTLIEGYSKRQRAAGRIVIPFYRPECRTLEGMRMGELVTLPTDNLTLSVTVGDTGDIAPTLRARALVTPSQSNRYFLPIIDAVDFNTPASGENVYPWNDRRSSLFIRRLHFKADANDITHLRVYRDDLKTFEASAEDNTADLVEGGDNAQVEGYFHFDPAHIGFAMQGLYPTIAQKELLFKYTKTAAGSVHVVRELLEQVQPLPGAANAG